MLFYRAKPIFANSKHELFNETACPICGNTPLIHDRWMAFRYSPMALFRGLILSFAISLLVSLLLYKVDFVWHLLAQFTYTTQRQIRMIFLAVLAIPSAFTIIHWEIIIGHLSEDDNCAVGLHCKRCGNGFAGLVEAFQQAAEGTTSIPDPCSSLDQETTTNEK